MDRAGFLREDIRGYGFGMKAVYGVSGAMDGRYFLWKIAEKSDILSYVKRNYADSRIIVVDGTEKCKCERRMEHEVLVV